MFWASSSRPGSTLPQAALDALRLARSFLLLEDGVSVDWEVDEGERASAAHAHRVPLRHRRIIRRPGAPAPARQPCLSPVERRGTLRSRIEVRREQELGGPVAPGSTPACRAQARARDC